MARTLSQALIRDLRPSCHLLAERWWSPSSSCRLVGLRWRSWRPERNGQIVEVVVETAAEEGAGVSSSQSTAIGAEVAARRLEDVIHGILVRRAAPDWLPFIPGSSYWMPPRSKRSYRLVEVMRRVSGPMTEEEAMSLTMTQGWPCAERLLGDSVEKPKEISMQSDDEDS